MFSQFPQVPGRLKPVLKSFREWLPGHHLALTWATDGDTVALYKFTEQTGLTVADSSGHGNDLTLTALPGGTLALSLPF